MMEGMIYMKPLTLTDRVLIETVTTRFTGIDAPFVAFDRGDHIELKCPARIVMTPARLDQLKAQSHETRNVQAEETQVLLGTPISRGA